MNTLRRLLSIPFLVLSYGEGQTHHIPVRALDPPLVPCISDGLPHSSCRVRLDVAVTVDHEAIPPLILLTVRSINESNALLMVRRSNPRDEVSVSVKDVWGNEVALTNNEKKRQSSPSRYRSELNYMNELKPGEHAVFSVTLSEMYVLDKPGEYTVIVNQFIFSAPESKAEGSDRIVEYAQSKSTSFVVTPPQMEKP